VSATLAILAAGMGSRYGGLKQLDLVGPSGETVLDYAVYDALSSGFERVVFIIRRDFEAEFRDAIGRRFESLCEVAYAFQELGALPTGFTVPATRQKPWGTGHAVWCARHALSGPFAVVNADDFYGREAFELLSCFLARSNHDKPPGGCLIGYQLDRTLSAHGPVARGICGVGTDNRLLSITEHTSLIASGNGVVLSSAAIPPQRFTGRELVSMNCWGLPAGFASALEAQLTNFLQANLHHPKSEFYLPAAVAESINRGQLVVEALRTTSEWFGITYREDRAQVASSLLRLTNAGVYPSPLSSPSTDHTST
jgi:dTDP-glucose pyrophosphorylase